MGKETLTWEEFLNASTLLEKLSENLQVNWELEQGGDSNDVGSCFLKYICHKQMNSSHHDTPTKSNVDSATFSENATKTELISGNDKTDSDSNCVLRCEYHIVYSMSYSVPVLYFNISRPDGSLLTLDEVWSMFLSNKTMTSSLNMDMWGTLSQQDHPVLHLPFFTLHPCHTSNVMGSLWTSHQNPSLSYLITWLSIVGGELGLSIANELGQHLVSCGDDERPVMTLS